MARTVVNIFASLHFSIAYTSLSLTVAHMHRILQKTTTHRRQEKKKRSAQNQPTEKEFCVYIFCCQPTTHNVNCTVLVFGACTYVWVCVHCSSRSLMLLSSHCFLSGIEIFERAHAHTYTRTGIATEMCVRVCVRVSCSKTQQCWYCCCFLLLNCVDSLQCISTCYRHGTCMF